MSKITPQTAQQRLKHLAQRQLGSYNFIESKTTTSKTSTVEVATPSTMQYSSSAQQQQLSASVGATVTDELSELSLAYRASKRVQMKLERQQQNLEQVMRIAQEYCSEQQVAQDVDPDWFFQYCELVQDISSTGMQKLWAKILAAEIRLPGSFSLKTLMILRQMNVKDAQALQAAAAVSCRTKLAEPAHIYFGFAQQGSLWRWLTGKSRGVLNLSQFGLTYPQILNLMDLGLLHQSEIESGVLQNKQTIQWLNMHQSLTATVTQADLIFQYYKFTSTGAELLPLLSSQPNTLYWQAIQQLFSEVVSFQPSA